MINLEEGSTLPLHLVCRELNKLQSEDKQEVSPVEEERQMTVDVGIVGRNCTDGGNAVGVRDSQVCPSSPGQAGEDTGVGCCRTIP